MADLNALLRARYGASASSAPAIPSDSALLTTSNPNPTLQLLLQHKSIRTFAPTPLPAGTLELLIASAQSAPTSSNLQAWSVLSLTSPSRIAAFAALAGDQAWIRSAPLVLVFVADLHRLTHVSERVNGVKGEALRYTESWTLAVVDASLAAQNAVVAAEALGLGTCYVGAARNKPLEVAELLGLPERVVALFGLAVGWPGELEEGVVAPEVKPRLPLGEVLKREVWGGEEEGENLRRYDEALARFNERQGRAYAPAWTARTAERIGSVEALHGRELWREVLKERGFELR